MANMHAKRKFKIMENEVEGIKRAHRKQNNGPDTSEMLGSLANWTERFIQNYCLLLRIELSYDDT